VIDLELAIPDQLPPIRADRDRLHQVMVNLLSNAADFCDPDAGVIKIEAIVERNFLTVCVIDNGVGVPESAREVIFDKFQRTIVRESGSVLRTGLGLAICRRIVNQFGGRIWVDGGEGAGARFSFTVPLATG